MLIPEYCALCDKPAILLESHIVPKFVSRRLKQESLTKYLRSPSNPNRRVQDIETHKLLCADCEDLFNKFETPFAKQIYHPTLDGDLVDVLVSSEFYYFCASLVWRHLWTVMARKGDHPDEYSTKNWTAIEQKYESLKCMLQSRVVSKKDLQFHLINTRVFMKASSKGLNAFLNMTIGTNLWALNSEPGRLYSVISMNGMLLVSLVQSDAKNRFKWMLGNTCVQLGKQWCNKDHVLYDETFAKILTLGAEHQYELGQGMSDEQGIKLKNTIRKSDVANWVNSPHGKALAQDFANMQNEERRD